MVETIRAKILAVLAEASAPLDIQAVAEGAGSQVKSVTEALSRLNKDGYVDNPDKGFWQIKDAGKEELDRIAEQEPPKLPGEITETVPSQSDLFRSIGKKLGIGTKKRDIRLDAINSRVKA